MMQRKEATASFSAGSDTASEMMSSEATVNLTACEGFVVRLYWTRG